jgi:hypothetical protein
MQSKPGIEFKVFERELKFRKLKDDWGLTKFFVAPKVGEFVTRIIGDTEHSYEVQGVFHSTDSAAAFAGSLVVVHKGETDKVMLSVG